MMYLGNMRHRILIQHLESTRDEHGAPLEEWTDFARVWASMDAMSGKEYFAAQQVHGEAIQKIRIRYLKELVASPEWRILYEDRIYEITAILPNNERSAMTLMCKETDDGQV